jgi:hypothetical protein
MFDQMKGSFTWMNGSIRLWQGGRSELFDENFALCAKFSSKSYIMYHAAAGEAGVRVWHQAGIGCTA